MKVLIYSGDPSRVLFAQNLSVLVLKFRHEATEVEIIGLNAASRMPVDRFAVHDKPETVEHLMGHQ